MNTDKYTTENEWYKGYLESAHWKQLRRDTIKSTKKCERCSCPITLQVHHNHYKTLWKEQREDLEVLCNDCHMLEHKEKLGLSQEHIELLQCAAADMLGVIDPDPDGSWEWEEAE